MATNDLWAVDADGDWSVASNWSLGTVPNAGNNAVINTTDRHTITHGAGNDIVNLLVVGNDYFTLSGGSLRVLGNAGFLNGFTQTGGTFQAAKANMAGTVRLTGGAAEGATIFNSGGAAQIGNYTLGGSTVFNNLGLVDETAAVTLGDTTGTDATIDNSAGRRYVISGDYGIAAGGAGANVVNAGTLMKAAGSGMSVIGADIDSTGAIVASTGTLEFTGASNTITGTLSGAGQIAFGGTGVTTLTLGAVTLGGLDLLDSATLDLTGFTSQVNGAFDDSSYGVNTLDLGVGTLTLSGPSTFQGNFSDQPDADAQAYVTGTGALVLDGATSASRATFGGSLSLTNTGTFTQTGTVTLGDTAGSVVQFTNLGTYDLVNATLQRGEVTSGLINKGVFAETGTEGTVNAEFTNFGTINVNSAATADFYWLNNYGLITGAGTLALVAHGIGTLDLGTTLDVATLEITNNAALTISAPLDYYNTFIDQVNNTNTDLIIDAGFTLHGANNSFLCPVGGVHVYGTGVLTFAASATVSAGNMDYGGTMSVVNQGTVNQTGTIQLDVGFSGEDPAVVNQGVWDVTSATTLLNEGTLFGDASFTNLGTFAVSAGTGTTLIDTNFINESTINIATGTLESQGSLVNSGTIAGTDLQLGVGQAVFDAGTGLTVSRIDIQNAATVTLGASLTYAGNFNDNPNGTSFVNLGTSNLTLTGTASFISNSGAALITGSGTLFTNGATSLANLLLGGNTSLDNNGTLTAGGNLQLGGGSGSTGSALNGGTYNLVTDSAGITHGASLLSSFTNTGLFEKTGGAGLSVVNAPFTNDGTIAVTSGTIEFTAGSLLKDGTINGVVSTDGSGNVFVTHT